MSTENTNISTAHFTVQPHQQRFDVLDPDFSLKIKRKNYTPGAIYTLRTLLSAPECQRIIDAAESIGFQAAGLAIGPDVYRTREKTRNNLRVMFEDRVLADALWQRISRLVDPRFDNHQAHGLNWRFRVYRYDEGARFAPHADERMMLPGAGLQTMFTFMVYLSEPDAGGETTFFSRRKGGTRPTVTRVIRPRTGTALVFDHLLYHEGSEVRRGVKYVLRSDLVYQKAP